jgi:hypothetical protein
LRLQRHFIASKLFSGNGLLVSGALGFAILAVSVAAFAQLGQSVFSPRASHPTIGYYDSTRDPVSELNLLLAQGQTQLVSEGEFGYLESVLEALDIPVESQLALFARNSLQNSYIRPENPRLIFFNDQVVVASIRGAPLIEVAVQDPEKGVIFYTLAQEASNARFSREDRRCLQCHESLNSLGVPGMLVRSVMPSPDGTANPQLGNYLTDHRSPFEERWGGWYVTGQHGNVRHLGNGVVTDIRDEESIRDNQELTLRSIRGRADDGSYLIESSDVVSLMVFDHQMHMTNLLTRYGWEVRYAMRSAPESDSDLVVALHEVVDYMMFIDEVPLPSPLMGLSGFREQFESRPPTDSEGRSLRHLDLNERLMRYPLSYMIYSEAFDNLPIEARNAIYFRIWQIISGEDDDPRYERLRADDGPAIVGILRDTKPDLPEFFD